ncbi:MULTISPECIES: antitoxin Xre/MbcA/ParS toxin-binding domain-containing protein [Pseudomonas]|uniref:antitoxin Xre/MbcA/ParS toxin-binding domain-containing protein n=1 Tax=Pseudomonas TaxID=286 RepID=UPI00125CE2C1|nr:MULTISPECIES: antitoxin Xre/MbcA/ParS toxin-binding domain-containing protein [Pseudomonas]UFH30045.1 DUF2384 domain-containing protein [Pseudomonas sp. CIP-10]
MVVALGEELKVTPVKPSAILAGVRIENLSHLELVFLVKKGFALEALNEMLNVSELYSSKKILTRIMGKSIRTLKRHVLQRGPLLLNEYQSAVALQYALVLEHASLAFGNQRLAENWLKKPCNQFEGEIPLELIDNFWGYRLITDYLERVISGVYQ